MTRDVHVSEEGNAEDHLTNRRETRVVCKGNGNQPSGCAENEKRRKGKKREGKERKEKEKKKTLTHPNTPFATAKQVINCTPLSNTALENIAPPFVLHRLRHFPDIDHDLPRPRLPTQTPRSITN